LEVLCGAEWQNSIHHALLNNKLICNPAKNKNHESNLDRGLRQQLSSKFLTKSKRQKKLQKIVLTLYRTETGSDFELYSEKKLFNEIFVLLLTSPKHTDEKGFFFCSQSTRDFRHVARLSHL
jgi:hypothetical protein